MRQALTLKADSLRWGEGVAETRLDQEVMSIRPSMLGGVLLIHGGEEGRVIPPSHQRLDWAEMKKCRGETDRPICWGGRGWYGKL